MANKIFFTMDDTLWAMIKKIKRTTIVLYFDFYALLYFLPGGPGFNSYLHHAERLFWDF